VRRIDLLADETLIEKTVYYRNLPGQTNPFAPSGYGSRGCATGALIVPTAEPRVIYDQLS
jgi:hypothetical protein